MLPALPTCDSLYLRMSRNEESSGSMVVARFDVAHTSRPECPVYQWLCFPDPAHKLFESGERDESGLKIAFDLALFRSIFSPLCSA